MKRNRSTAILSMAVLLVGSCAAVQAASSPFKDGMAAFNARRFHEAESDFEQAAANSPSNQEAFIMLGKTRELLQDADGAREAYQSAFKINPFNSSGAAAKQAILTVTANKEAQKHQPPDDPNTIRQTVRTIHVQAQALGRNYINRSNAHANNKMWQYSDDQYWAWANPGDVSGWNTLHQLHHYMDNQTQAYRYQSEGYKRAASVQQSANNLVDLIADHASSSAPHLRAAGTNLYVRYYGGIEPPPLPPEDPLIELHAVAKSLGPVKIK